MFCEIELCKSLVLNALQAIDRNDENLSSIASVTKAKLCETAQLITNEAIQMHGGIGVSDEYDLGLYIKRARVAQQSCGDAYYHLDRFARLRGY